MIVASIDIGTNTVLMLIAEINKMTRSLKILENEYRIPRLGRNLIDGKDFPPDNINRFYDVLEEYKIMIERYNCSTILTAATSAFRRAGNSNDIINEVKDRFGIDINIISGEEEAALSYLGAVYSHNDGSVNMVIDIGGGSTELITGTGLKINYMQSFPLGVVISSETYLSTGSYDLPSFQKRLREVFHKSIESNRAPDKAIAVAGTPTTLACIKNKQSVFDEGRVEGTVLTGSDLEMLINELGKLTPAEIAAKYHSVVKGREDLILSGSYILQYIMKLYDLNEILVSTKGVRYGLIYNFMDIIN